MTYEEIYAEFRILTQLKDEDINDYRPCHPHYGFPFVENGIIVWLKTKAIIIYIAKKNEETVNEVC